MMDGWFGLLSSLETSYWVCLLESRQKLIFYWNTHLFFLIRSSFKFFAVKVISWATVMREVSSANSLQLETRLSERSLIYIKEKREPRIDSWVTHALISAHEKYSPFKTIFCFLVSTKLIITFSKLPVAMMMMMMMKNCFCGMVDRRKAYSLISSRNHCQRSSPLRIPDMPRAGAEPAQNLILGFVQWSCAVVITTTPCHHFVYSIFL